MDVRELPPGQLLARTRCGTHASGLAFDRKKTSLLTEQAQAFIAEQSLCVIAGPGPQTSSSVLPRLFAYRRPLPLLGLRVRQAFFHCPKYIKTRIPDYTAQLALCISGQARVLEVRELPVEIAHNCPAAERVVALMVQHVVIQNGDWSTALAYERAHAEAISLCEEPVIVCRV